MTWAVRVSGGARVGTGAVLSEALVVTSEHVVSGVREADVRDETGATVKCEVVDRDPQLDVAVLAPVRPQAAAGAN